MIVVPEDAEHMQERCVAMYHGLKPGNDYQAYFADQAALISIRIDRCQRMERRIRDKVRLKAGLCWEEDRRLDAEMLGGMLSKKPAEAIDALRKTPQGCEWLMGRWAMLLFAANNNPGNAWTEEQAALAFDLMATPRFMRQGIKPGTSIDFDGNVIESGEDPAAVARRMIADLKERRDEVAALDEVERGLTEADLNHDADPELRRLRRYESTLTSRFRWTIKQVDHVWDGLPLDPAYYPRWFVKEHEQDPLPIPKPDPKHPDEIAAENHPADSPHPPFCLTPDEFPEPGQDADIPKILWTRKQKRLAKAEARRESDRRKIDKFKA